jgi:hypothetical protein
MDEQKSQFYNKYYIYQLFTLLPPCKSKFNDLFDHDQIKIVLIRL